MHAFFKNTSRLLLPNMCVAITHEGHIHSTEQINHYVIKLDIFLKFCLVQSGQSSGQLAHLYVINVLYRVLPLRKSSLIVLLL